MLHGTYTYVLQDENGLISTTHSISAGLDYPAIGPEHAALHDSGRAEYVAASDAEALEACVTLARTEGIVPALESAHAVAECIRRAPAMNQDEIVIVKNIDHAGTGRTGNDTDRLGAGAVEVLI